MSQSVDVARWVTPAIEHAQDVLFGGFGQESGYNFMLFFGGSCFSSTFRSFFIIGFFFFVLVVSFSQKSNCLFWVCLSTFWFFFLCSDLRIVFKRRIYPVLSWC